MKTVADEAAPVDGVTTGLGLLASEKFDHFPLILLVVVAAAAARSMSE